MVGAVPNSAVAVRGLPSPPAIKADARPAATLAATGASGAAGGPLIGAGLATGPASPEFAFAANGGAAAPGLSVAAAPGRNGMTAGGTPGLPGMPGTGPPVHIRVLAGEPGFLAPRPPPTGAAATIGFPHAWQKLTGWDIPGLGAGSGAWQ